MRQKTAMTEFDRFVAALVRKRRRSSDESEPEDDFTESGALAARINAAGDSAEVAITWQDWPHSMLSWQNAVDYLANSRLSKRVKR